MGPEYAIEKECLIWLNTNGFYAWKNASTGTYDEALKTYRKSNPFQINGVSDIIAIRGGITFFIEVKGPRGTQSKMQRAFEAQLIRRSIPYLLVKSTEELKIQLTKYNATGYCASNEEDKERDSIRKDKGAC